MKYYSQANQDLWVGEFYNHKRNGFFVDLGAYDGIQTSNTYFFEKYLDWDGICVEANPIFFEKLNLNRKSKNLNYAVSDHEGSCMFDLDHISDTGIIVNCTTLEKILDQVDFDGNIDYLSVDIEGHEYTILKDFNFNKYNIGLITIEHNLYINGPDNKNLIYELLTKNNFERIVDNAVCLDKNPQFYNKPYEDWYINKSLITNQTQTPIQKLI